MERWVRLSRRQDAEAAEDTLHSGVPLWLKPSLLSWIKQFFILYDEMGDDYQNTQLLFEIERSLQLALVWGRSSSTSAYSSLQQQMTNDEELMLDVIDFLVSQGLDSTETDTLEDALSTGHSLWTVNTESKPPRLERRVDETTRAIVTDLIGTSGRVGQYLAVSWGCLYKRHPDATKGYHQAVKAVEAASIPIVIPDDTVPTMGKVIGAVRDAHDKWECLLPGGVETVRLMMDSLWKGQFDRHGNPDEEIPIEVSLEEAEAALNLAIALCNWFTKGYFKRKSEC